MCTSLAQHMVNSSAPGGGVSVVKMPDAEVSMLAPPVRDGGMIVGVATRPFEIARYTYLSPGGQAFDLDVVVRRLVGPVDDRHHVGGRRAEVESGVRRDRLGPPELVEVGGVTGEPGGDHVGVGHGDQLEVHRNRTRGDLGERLAPAATARSASTGVAMASAVYRIICRRVSGSHTRAS